jgi:hypothetical protein
LLLGGEGNGTLDIENGGTVTAAATGVGNSSPGTGTLNLRTGGTLITPLFEFGIGGGGNAVLNLNGGSMSFANPSAPLKFTGILSGAGTISFTSSQSVVVAGAVNPGVAAGARRR